MYRSSYDSDQPYVPDGIDEVVDLLGSMMLSSPTFKDKTGYFPERNIDTEFFSLKEGLKTIHENVGDASYQSLVKLSDKMRTYFEADPEDKTEDSLKGRDCIIEMENILKASARRKPR